MKKTAFLVMFAILLAPLAFASNGKATFEAKCKMCHGADLSKKAIDTTKSDETLVKFLLENPKHKGKVADEAAAKAVVAYIKSIKK